MLTEFELHNNGGVQTARPHPSDKTRPVHEPHWYDNMITKMCMHMCLHTCIIIQDQSQVYLDTNSSMHLVTVFAPMQEYH